MNLVELKSFLKRVTSEFDANSKINIKIPIHGIHYIFNSLEEFLNSPESRALYNLKECTIYLHNDSSHTLMIKLGHKDRCAHVIASAPQNQVFWCHGMIAATLNFIQPYRGWYNFIKKMPHKIILLIFMGLLWALRFLYFLKFKIPDYFIWTGLLIWLVYGLGFLAGFYFFPAGVIEIREKQSFLRKYNRELTLIFTGITALVTIFAFFRGGLH